MRWTILLVVFVLASCAKPPEPPPELPVVVEPAEPVRISAGDVAALKTEIERSRTKLAAYQALPPCAPSGVVECRDDERADHAATAERNATEAFTRLKRSRERLPAARHSAKALRDAVRNLTGD